jgi:predicted nucleotidyltransferase
MIDALFGSKTRVKLLHLFLNNPGRAFYVREITRKIDEQINSVRRELANMLEVGVIKSDSANNRLYYEVDDGYTYYKQLHEILADTSYSADSTMVEKNDWTRRFKQLGDTRVVIFSGKLAHGSDSDIDLLVAGDISKIKLKNLVKALEKEEGSSLTYTSMSYEDFYYRLSVRDQFIGGIMSAKHSVIIDTEKILEQPE